MSNDKVSKLIVGADVTGLARAQPIIDGLTKSLRGLNEAQGNGSKSGVAGQGNAQGIIAATAAATKKSSLDLVNSLKLMGTSNKQLLTALASDAHNQIERIKKDIGSLNQEIARSMANHARLSSVKTPLNTAMAAKNLEDARNLAIARDAMKNSLGVQEQGASLFQSVLNPPNARMQQIDAARAAPYMTGGVSNLPSSFGVGGNRGRLDKVPDINDEDERRIKKMVIAGVTAVSAGVSAGANTYQAGKTMEIENLAAIQQMGNGRLLSGMLRGDLRDSWFVRNKNTVTSTEALMTRDETPLKNAVSEKGGFAGKYATNIRLGADALLGGSQAFVGAIATAKGDANGPLAIATGTNSAALSTMKLTKGEAERVEREALTGGLTATEMSNPGTMAVFDLMQREAGMRVGGSRRIGRGGVENARYAGSNQGYYGSESIAIAEAMQSRIGLAGTSYGMTSKAMDLAGRGLDMGVTQDAIASAFNATGFSQSKGFKAVTDAISIGLSAGFKDPRANQEIVGAIAEGARGAILKDTTGLNDLAGFLGGGSNSGSVQEAQARRSGLSGLDSLYQTNPFYQGVSVAIANGVLGRNAGVGAMMTAAGAKSSDLLIGGQQFEDQGMVGRAGETQRKRMVDDRIRAVVESNLYKVQGGREEFARAGGNYHNLSEKTLRMSLFGVSGLGDTEVQAAANAKMFKGFDPNSDTKANGRMLKSMTDYDAANIINTEEKTKMALNADMIGKKIAEHYRDMLKEIPAIVSQILHDEKTDKNLQLNGKDVFRVRVLMNESTPEAPTPHAVRPNKNGVSATAGGKLNGVASPSSDMGLGGSGMGMPR